METDKRVLMQKMQEILAVIEYMGSTTVKLMEEYFSKLKLELNTAVAANVNQAVQIF